MGKILTSTQIGEKNVRDLSYMFKYRYARSKFSKILFQEGFKENIKICLEEKSFQEIYEIITNALTCCQNDSQFEDIRLITKSTFYYYTIQENKNKTSSFHFIFQEIAKKSPFNFWKQQDFWKFYLDAEIAENSYSVTLGMKDIDDYYFSMLMLLARLMIDLNIDVKLIHCILCDNIAYSYIKKVLLFFTF
jgi:hypothetical protein